MAISKDYETGMTKIYLLGSASGVYPDYRRRYTSWILEEKCGRKLLFDVGPGSAEASYCLGINPMCLNRIFLTHAHLDHTGGFPTLLMTMVKKMWDTDQFAVKRSLDIYSPCPMAVDGARLMLEAEFGDNSPVIFQHHDLSPGPVYVDDEVAIDCAPTLHRNYINGKPKCYGYRLSFKDGRTLIYTGDFKELDEFSHWMQEPCSLMLLETGHHRACELCKTIRSRQWNVEKLLFVHHGLDFLNSPSLEKTLAEKEWGEEVTFAEDSMVYVF